MIQKESLDVHKYTFIAWTTKGLEHISEKEIKTIFPNAHIINVLDKRIIFSIDRLHKKLLKFRTVDDVHFLLDSHISIKELNEKFILDNLPLGKIGETWELVSYYRHLDDSFSLTISRYRNKSIDLKNIKTRISKKIARYLKIKYTPYNHTNFDVRVHIDSSNVFYSCRISSKSLYDRSYRTCQKKGALKPTIAAALCMLVNPSKGEKIVDNFCGTGTILCEAKLQGLQPYGGDIDEEYVTCAQTNMKNISYEDATNIKVLDATSTKWPNNYFDYAISNYPWGKQVHLDRIVRLYSLSISEYSRILKPEGSITLLGIKPDLIIKHLKKNFRDHAIVKFRIGFLGQNPWVICAYPKGKNLGVTFNDENTQGNYSSKG